MNIKSSVVYPALLTLLLVVAALAIHTLDPLPVVAEGSELESVPATPDRPTATTIHEGMVDLEWNDVPRAASYDVQAFRSDWFDLPDKGVCRYPGSLGQWYPRSLGHPERG